MMISTNMCQSLLGGVHRPDCQSADFIIFSILALVAVLALIYTIAAKDKRTMAKLADVQASLTTLQTTTDAVKAYAQQQAAPAATEADLDSIKAAIDARTADLQAILPTAAPATDDPAQAMGGSDAGTDNDAPAAGDGLQTGG